MANQEGQAFRPDVFGLSQATDKTMDADSPETFRPGARKRILIPGFRLEKAISEQHPDFKRLSLGVKHYGCFNFL